MIMASRDRFPKARLPPCPNLLNPLWDKESVGTLFNYGLYANSKIDVSLILLLAVSSTLMMWLKASQVHLFMRPWCT